MSTAKHQTCVPNRSLLRLSACEAASAIRRGEVSAEELTRACLERIETRDALVGAWAHVDPDLATSQAHEADAQRATGASLGPLHGIPVAIKDIFDTADMPTECGSELYRNRQSNNDAVAVESLRRAGAVILGKTVTAELAMTAPGHTANPLDLQRTPGGSSSGSAAAVADFMVPLAIGSQTGGSVIRPASFCGIYGFKPTFNAIPREGMHILSRRLDHVGVFARDLEDVVLIADVLMQHDDEHALTDALARGFDGTPRIAVVRGPVWHHATEDAKSAFETYAADITNAKDVSLPASFDQAAACQERIMTAELAANLAWAYGRSPELLRDETRRRIRDGLTILASEYVRAREAADVQAAELDGIFREYDALVTLPAPGEAPLGLSSTGNHIFCAIWTLIGTPSVTLPMLHGENGLPIGVQVIGPRGADARLLAIARWLEDDSR